MSDIIQKVEESRSLSAFHVWIEKQQHKILKKKKANNQNNTATVSSITLVNANIRDVPWTSILSSELFATSTITEAPQNTTQPQTIAPVVPTVTNNFICNTCQMTFDDVNSHHQHFKSDFHLTNIKRKVNNLPPLSETEFKSQGSSNKNDNEVSLSRSGANSSDESDESLSSDNEDNDDESTAEEEELRHKYEDNYGVITKEFSHKHGPSYAFQCNAINTTSTDTNNNEESKHVWKFSLSSGLLSTASSPFAARDWWNCKENGSLWKMFTNQLQSTLPINNSASNTVNKNIAVFILRSGRFVGAIFNTSNDSLIVHKVVRRYTIRAKSGGNQSKHDNNKGKARSMGAQLRRYGEKMLDEDIEGIFQSWHQAGYLTSCQVICIASTKSMRYKLFHNSDDEDSVNTSGLLLDKNDPRISFVPFVVKKPTLENAQEIYQKITQVTFQYQEISLQSELPPSNIGNMTVNDHTQAVVLPPVVVELPRSLVSDQIIVFIKNEQNDRSDTDIADAIQDLADQYNDDTMTWEVVINLPEENRQHMYAPLHLATQRNLVHTVRVLLERSANPEQQDLRGKTPYLHATTKPMRDIYRVLRAELGEDRWHWIRAQVPEPLTDELLEQQKNKEKDKKKKQQQRKKEQKVKAEQDAKQAKEQLEKQDAQRRDELAYLDRERRALAGNCAFCQCELFGKDFFSVLNVKCCTTDCVSKYRRRLNAEAALQRFQKKA